jgi:SAM-dependent methyltransferase
MDISVLGCLRCPFCGGTLTMSPMDHEAGKLEYGILSCYCGRYPVVAGIPVFRKETFITGQVIPLIEAGRRREALLALILPPSAALAPAKMWSLPAAREIGRLIRSAHRRALLLWKKKLITALTEQVGRVTACDLLNLYFSNEQESCNYFAYRLGQPRHLVALSFASLIHQPKQAILELGSGCGHMTWSLAQRAGTQPVFGVDTFFFGLYLAKHWIAPQVEYICCEADRSLPFVGGLFSVIFCSDAFHYFVDKALCFRELQRLTAAEGLIMLVWVHNAHVRQPFDGLPLPPEGYQSLAAGLPHRLLGSRAVLMRYLQKQGPPLEGQADMEHLAHEPLLSLVASRQEDVFQDYGPFEDWPHAVGSLGLNPLYVEEGREDGGTIYLRRRFPSAFYEEEHAECKEYLPERVEVPLDVLAALASGRRTPAMERLIEQCVVVGMPEHYR